MPCIWATMQASPRSGKFAKRFSPRIFTVLEKGGPGLRRLECASVKRLRIHSSLLTSKEPPRSASGVDMASIDRMRVPALPDDTHRGVIKICGVAVKAPQFAYTRFPHQPT